VRTKDYTLDNFCRLWGWCKY